MYINKVMLYGNLTRDPEVKALPSGSQVASFGLATNRTYKDKDGGKKEETQFHNIVVFGKQAEVVGQYLKKGRPVYIEGRIQTRSWDGTDGQKKYRTEVIVEKFQFGAQGTGGANTKNIAEAPKDDSSNDSGINYPEEEINPDDIPF